MILEVQVEEKDKLMYDSKNERRIKILRPNTSFYH